MKHISKSERQTKQFAKEFGVELTGGDIVCLHGDLGVGKTAFVKGLAELLNIKTDITSPTFTLMNFYNVEPVKNGIERLIHIDTYRLKDAEELIEIGAEDYIGDKNTLTVVEWPEKIQELLENKKVVNVSLNHLAEDSREIIIED